MILIEFLLFANLRTIKWQRRASCDFYFRNELAHDVYLASADWMSRNLFRRIEVAFPVLDKQLKKRVMQEGLQIYLKDNLNAWELAPDGQYHRKKLRPSQSPFSAQLHLMHVVGE